VAFSTLFQVVWLEFLYWGAHYAFHKVPALWEIHKIHHSAEVMTPLSEWRVHPIEFVAFANVLAVASGTAFGGMEWLFGPSAHPLTLFEINLILLLHLATFHHLRHSGIWIAATGWLGRLVHSPAHHQIHHSVKPEHFDSNLGYALSLWDWAFGTLCIPEARARITIGVPGEPVYRGLADMLFRPLAAGAMRLRPARAIARRQSTSL
jgi:sterol desaturase/sphingolipid hydroxylase (fatty acid hydroxylase superfamily)